MRVAIEATLAQGRMTGLGLYVINLLRAFAAMKTGHEFLLLHSTNEWTGPDFGTEFKPVSYFCLKQSLGIALRLNRVLAKERADIFHATCTTGMPPHIAIPAVTTIHDLYPLLHPEHCGFPQCCFFKQLLKWTVKNSDFFICNSAFTATELCKHLTISPEKIAVTHLAPAISAMDDAAIPNDGRSGILCVGAIEPRKNQLLLLEAYRQALVMRPDMPSLTFIGPDRGDGAELDLKIKTPELSGHIRHWEYLSPENLAECYRNSALFVFPSLYEGFGIPLLEAMRYRLPVICGDIPALREIGGEYPLFIRPDDCGGWRDAMCDFFFGELRSGLFQKSPNLILRQFSWAHCAEQTIEIYLKTVSLGHKG